MQMRDRGSSVVLKCSVWGDLYVHISVGKGTGLPSSLLQGCACITSHQIGSQGTNYFLCIPLSGEHGWALAVQGTTLTTP